MEWEREKVGKIPVRNLWLLMLYASECKYFAEHLSGAEDVPHNALDLVGKIMCDLLESRLRRELSRSFVHNSDELNRVRGRINVLRTERQLSLSRGRVYCEYEELSLDTHRNRYTLNALSKLKKLTDEYKLAHRSNSIIQYYKQLGIKELPTNGYKPSKERFGRHESDDRKILLIAELIHDMALLNESVGTQLLPMPEKEEHWVRKLFEKAVAGFYDLTLSKHDWQVQSNKKLKWQTERESGQLASLMPSMELDILLESSQLSKRIIIDTKFTNIITTGRFNNTTFNSNYIYQLYTYLMSQMRESDPLSLTSTGILLHPSIDGEYTEEVTIQGHRMRFCTVNLMAETSEITQRLTELIAENGVKY